MSVTAPEQRRFVLANEASVVQTPWTLNELLCHPSIVKCEHLVLLRAQMPAHGSHPFHRHPIHEEIIYILDGQAEQWVGTERRILKPGEMAFIPKAEVHGTYNTFAEKLVFLAILSSADGCAPTVVDVSDEPPWRSIRNARQA
jgi:quercetin dioxygenase-like cupin family protein